MTQIFCLFSTSYGQRSEVLFQPIAKETDVNRKVLGLLQTRYYSPDISSRHCLAVLLNDKSIFVGLVQESVGGKEVLSFSERVLKSIKKIDYSYLSFMY